MLKKSNQWRNERRGPLEKRVQYDRTIIIHFIFSSDEFYYKFKIAKSAKVMWHRRDSNQWPFDCKAKVLSATPSEKLSLQSLRTAKFWRLSLTLCGVRANLRIFEIFAESLKIVKPKILQNNKVADRVPRSEGSILSQPPAKSTEWLRSYQPKTKFFFKRRACVRACVRTTL